MASMITVIGWFSAKTFRPDGMVSVLTKALLANVSGNIITNVNHWTASTLLAITPMIAANQENARVNNKIIPPITSQSAILAFDLKPITSPVTSITIVDIEFLNKSDTTWPFNTAKLDIGNDLNLSTIPFCKSFATEIAVVVEPKATVWMIIPAIRKFR